MISGDRLIDLSAAKLEMLQKITPSFGEAAVPVDLFDADMPSVFTLGIKKPFGEWTVVGFFNASLTEPVEKNFSLRRLSLDPGKQYLAFDFWKQQFLGEMSDEISVTIPQGSVHLLSLYEKSGSPQWISTDRHVLQGAVEIEDISWNEAAGVLSGISLGPLNTSHNVFVYLPEPHPWTWGGYVLFRDYDAYSLKLVEEHIIRVHVLALQAAIVYIGKLSTMNSLSHSRRDSSTACRKQPAGTRLGSTYSIVRRRLSPQVVWSTNCSGRWRL